MGNHEFNTQYAAAEACLQCHDDDHSRNYKQSQHYELWTQEVQGHAAPGSGVSCASCHMPRVAITDDAGETTYRVQHNQNDNLRPNEKMLRTACMNRHGLPFAIDALADPELIKHNFNRKPTDHVPSVDWVRDHHQRTATQP